jgi:hypothetical protein
MLHDFREGRRAPFLSQNRDAGVVRDRVGERLSVDRLAEPRQVAMTMPVSSRTGPGRRARSTCLMEWAGVVLPQGGGRTPGCCSNQAPRAADLPATRYCPWRSLLMMAQPDKRLLKAYL